MKNERKTSGVAKVFGLIVALVGLLASGVGIIEFVNPTSTSTPTTTPVPSFLEQLEGEYTLESWIEANQAVALGAKVTKGTMNIDSTGIADWTVTLEQIFENPGKVEMTSHGKVQLNTKQLEGIKDGKLNNTHYLDNKWIQVSPDVNLAVRGWNSGSPNDYFMLSVDSPSNSEQILETKNSRGTFVWVKQDS